MSLTTILKIHIHKISTTPIFCFPGKHYLITDHCDCDDGFSGPECLQVNQPASVDICLVKLQRLDGDIERNQIEADCKLGETVFVNDPDMNNIRINWNVRFDGSEYFSSDRPSYVDEIEIGLTGLEASFTHSRTASREAFTETWSESNPLVNTFYSDNWSHAIPKLQHNDRLEIEIRINTGGFIQLERNFPFFNGPEEYYHGTSHSGATFVFDFEKPYHCSVGGACSDNMLERGQAITDNPNIYVRWSGWNDELSGIIKTDIKVMKTEGSPLRCLHDTDLECTSDTGQCSFTLTSTGVYCVHLTVFDVAGNTNYALRYLMFDNINKPGIYNHNPLRVVSAISDTGYEWQTDTYNSLSGGPKVHIQWTGHFKNEEHYNRHLLGPIGDFNPDMAEEYDELHGTPPTTRSREPILNIYGIVKFQIAYAIDHNGGSSLTQPPNNWMDIALSVRSYIYDEALLDLPREDGDAVRIWVKAFDVLDNTVIDNTTVHIDSSPPVIGDIYLAKNGMDYLTVHSSVDLFDMKVMFDCFDDHSGLYTIEWTLHEMRQEAIIHGNGTVAVERPSEAHPECNPPECTCIPKGECFFRDYSISLDEDKMAIPIGIHDNDYVFTITVTNQARLHTSREFKVTVDTSPPHEGSIIDNIPGEPDLDYQQEYLIHASWDGFFDRESGVSFYVYYFGESCVSADAVNISIPIAPPLIDTRSTHAEWLAPGPGKYHSTVIAYNRALEPSKPVCSDGVTIDTTVPVIQEVIIDDVFMRPGLLKDDDDILWFVDQQRYKQILINTSDICIGAARYESNMNMYPTFQGNPVGAYVMSDYDCSLFGASPEHAFIRKENHLSLRWIGYDDESSIFSYDVGISSTSSSLDPDVLPFTSTNGHSEFITYHPNLGEGSTFYIAIRAVNKAGLYKTEIVGPFIVEVTPPVFDGEELSVTLHKENEVLFLVARWQKDAFYDEEDMDNLNNFQVAVGDFEGGSNLLQFTPVTSYQDVCELSIPPTCVAIPTSILDWQLHGEHDYFVSIKVENVAGLSVVVSSTPYRHMVSLPTRGNVIEIVDSANKQPFGISSDIDYQLNAKELHCAWSGFSYVNQEVSYKVGLGTSPGIDDVEQFTVVEPDVSSYIFKNLGLISYQKYFVTINAFTEVGNISVSSDGVTVVNVGDILSDVYVYDGLGCTKYSNETAIGDTHHTMNIRSNCIYDTDYQASTTVAASHWKLGDSAVEYVTRIEWGFQAALLTDGSESWDFMTPYIDVNMEMYFQMPVVELLPGSHYRSVVRFCHPAGCFQPIASNGFYVTPTPPIPMGFTEILYLNETNELSFSWNSFMQEELSDRSSMDFYEWNLIVVTTPNEASIGEALFLWNQVILSNNKSDELQYTTRLPQQLNFTECIRLALRGYNKAGLYSTMYADIKDCDAINPKLIVPNIVIDAVGEYTDNDDVRDVYLEENAHWQASDAEYTPSNRKLSAVWPSLRYDAYSWKVVKGDLVDHRAYYTPRVEVTYAAYSCDDPGVLACGRCNENFVNIDNMELLHGHRYHICIHANETLKDYEKVNHLLPDMSSCSNGIVVDRTPPKEGNVWFGWNGKGFQTTTSELIVSWEKFYDVEEHGQTSHSSGIRKYDIAVGTSPGGVDLSDFVDVGITNWIVLHDLQLQSGQTYYATVRATDFVGLTTQSVSDGLTIDVTPPEKSDEFVHVGGHYWVSTSGFTAYWSGVFYDIESGISHYEWCIGSEPGLADVFPCTVTYQEEIVHSDDSTFLIDGHIYYVMVKAYNGASLSTSSTSWGIIVDSSPPVAGVVYDGEPDSVYDEDYQIHIDHLSVWWEGFHDPHTEIVGYSWKVGSCVNCDDILEKQDVGMLAEMKASHLNLEPGVRYYTTVTACNAAGLCTSVTSDGIIPDNSAPIGGMVYDGASGDDQHFQASRTSLAAHWYNFHDPQSQLSHYEWRAGTTPGGDDVLATTQLHLTETAFISQLQQLLPKSTRIFTTVRAYNKEGLFTEKTSNGFIVDDTPPEIREEPTIDCQFGSIKPGTQVWSSTLRVVWEFHDPESNIETQLLSVFTHQQTEVESPTIRIPGGVGHHTFTNMSLHDGNTYHVRVVACNGARLCSSRESNGVLVDSSPPTVGTFAVSTDHAAELSRHRDGWMTYYQDQGDVPAHVKLAWLGFADVHSGISHYHIAVGTQFGAWDLTHDQYVKVDYTDGDTHYDEGVVQTTIVDISRDLLPYEHVYCTLWAVNGAGLRSYEAHESFLVTPSNDNSGLLSLLRQCSVQTCQGDCTCAPQNQLCQYSPEMCTNVSGEFALAQHYDSYQHVEVVDVLDYRENADEPYRDYNFTPSACAIGARWRISSEGISFARYEWSVGTKGEAPGSGLLNLSVDRIWHDAGLVTFAVFNVKTGYLTPKVKYVFYIKAWYDQNTYLVFESDGITSLFNPPKMSSSRKVKDVINEWSPVDTDYSTSLVTIGVSWKDVFIGSNEDIDYFLVSLSLNPGGDDISSFDDNVVSSDVNTSMLYNLPLKTGRTYYSNVMAVNCAGLRTIATSDGVMIDTAPPTVGVVYDGLGVHDADYQNYSNKVSASWYGFSDLESSIHHYLWCVGSAPGYEDILTCTNMGLHLSASDTIQNSIQSGMLYYSKVVAVDAAGYHSLPGISNGIKIDTTSPECQNHFISESNLLRNPSFEDTNCSIDFDQICTSIYWQIHGVYHVIKSEQILTSLGKSYVVIYGSLSQNISTSVGDKYKLSFYVSHLPNPTTPLMSQEGYVQIPGVHHVFKLYQRTGHNNEISGSLLEWYEHVYYFTATSDTSIVTLGSLGRNGMAVHGIHVNRLTLTNDDDGSCVHGHIRTNSIDFTVTASWEIIDLESPVVEYMWAIGSTKGGTQIQTFVSVGSSSLAFSDDLTLAHGIPIYITAVARNAAGLRSVHYSDPIMVDVTAPELCCLMNKHVHDDELYQVTSVISYQWNVSDPESGVDSCEWAIGLNPESTTLSQFTATEYIDFAEMDLTGILTHGQTVYCTIRCKNSVGLSTTMHSRGVTIVTEPPMTEAATLRVIAMSPSEFESRNNHQSQTNLINIAWDGFHDHAGISHYECKLYGGVYDSNLDWKVIGVKEQVNGVISGLNLMSYKTYQVQLRAVNHGGFCSDPIVSNITVETSPPVFTGLDMQYTWFDNRVHLDWSGVFKSNSSMIYELTISSVLGGSDIIKWFDTRVMEYNFMGADREMEYFVTIAAANEAGLYTMYDQVFVY
ncbi:uncharacterized protein LOC144354078 [Saccoglossus kowalevskii]